MACVRRRAADQWRDDEASRPSATWLHDDYEEMEGCVGPHCTLWFLSVAGVVLLVTSLTMLSRRHALIPLVTR